MNTTDSNSYLISLLNASFFLYSEEIPKGWKTISEEHSDKTIYSTNDETCFVYSYSDSKASKDAKKNKLLNNIIKRHHLIVKQLKELNRNSEADMIKYFYNENLSRAILVLPNLGESMGNYLNKSEKFLSKNNIERKLLSLYKILIKGEETFSHINAEDILISDSGACLVNFDLNPANYKNGSLKYQFAQLFTKLGLPVDNLKKIHSPKIKRTRGISIQTKIQSEEILNSKTFWRKYIPAFSYNR